MMSECDVLYYKCTSDTFKVETFIETEIKFKILERMSQLFYFDWNNVYEDIS